jgi:hypothetical protein
MTLLTSLFLKVFLAAAPRFWRVPAETWLFLEIP